MTNTLPSWVFIQRTASGDYRHEIRRVPSGFMLFLNVCDATGGCSTLAVYPTYYEALEALAASVLLQSSRSASTEQETPRHSKAIYYDIEYKQNKI